MNLQHKCHQAYDKIKFWNNPFIILYPHDQKQNDIGSGGIRTHAYE